MRTRYEIKATLIVHEDAGATFESIAGRWAALDPMKAVTIEGRRIGEADVEAFSIALVAIESDEEKGCAWTR
jgi:hypothetical protein